MASSEEPKVSQEPTAKEELEWARSTWNSAHVVKIIASSADMIQIVSSKPDQDGKIFRASVHKELLCFFSPYYTAALKGGFAEAKKNTLTLDLSYHQMANLVSWLYSGDPVAYTEYELLDLYVFADEKMMLAFRRSIMTRLIKFNDPGYQHLDDDVAMPFVKRLPESSGLFRFLVDYWVGVWGRVDCRTRMAEWDADGRVPRKFFYQALEKFASLVDEPRPRDDSRDHRTCLTRACNYHEHPNRTEWERTCNQLPKDADFINEEDPYDEYYTEQ